MIPAGITCKEGFLQKSIESGVPLKYNATRYKQKTGKVVVIRPPTC